MRNNLEVDCRGYGVTLTPWACLENQLSPMCLPGWPCEDCEKAIGVTIALDVPACRICGCTEERACEGGCYWVEDPEGIGDLYSSCLPQIQAKVGRSHIREASIGARNRPGSGMPSLKSPKRKPVPKGMTRAVARDLGLI